MTTTGPRPTHPTTVVTVTMTETVTREITLTPARLADLLDITPDHVTGLLAHVDQWGARALPVMTTRPATCSSACSASSRR